MRACGSASPTILICLLCNIYRSQGYYILWDEDMPFLIAEEVGVSEGAVMEVIKKTLQVGFFDIGLYEKYGILTSPSIQNRFLKACEKRGKIVFILEYQLVSFDSGISSKINTVSLQASNNTKGIDNELQGEEIRFSAPETSSEQSFRGKKPRSGGVLGVDNSQSKVKESKVKESKDKILSVDGSQSSTADEPPKQKKLTGKKPVKEYSHNSAEYQAAKYLADSILKRDPKNKRIPKSDEDLYKWCVHIDYILRLDDRSIEELRDVLKYATTDTFWQTNILSTKTLRDKFGTLILRIRNSNQSNSNKKQGRQNASQDTGFNPAKMGGFKNALDRYDDDGNEIG